LPVENAEMTCSDYVLAAYDKICYMGKVLENNLSDKTVHIDFIVQSYKVVNIFPWPNKHDRVWIKSKAIPGKIEHPIVTGKGGRMLFVSDDVM